MHCRPPPKPLMKTEPSAVCRFILSPSKVGIGVQIALDASSPGTNLIRHKLSRVREHDPMQTRRAQLAADSSVVQRMCRVCGLRRDHIE